MDASGGEKNEGAGLSFTYGGSFGVSGEGV